MLGDLLRFVSGPQGYSGWWLVVAGVLAGLLIAWYVGVFVWTLPPTTLRANPVLGPLHRRWVARSFNRTLDRTTTGLHSGALTPQQAFSSYHGTFRSFLAVATGQRVQYMPVREMADGQLAPAVPLVTALDEARFSPDSRADVDALGRAVQGVISSWI